MQREYTYDEVFRSVKKIFSYLEKMGQVPISDDDNKVDVLFRNFLLMYSFLKSFDINDLNELENNIYNKENDKFKNIKKDIYDLLYGQINSVSIKYHKFNGRKKYLNYQDKHDSKFYFLSYEESEKETLIESGNNLLINNYEDFKSFIKIFISKEDDFKKIKKEIYASQVVINDYFSQNEWQYNNQYNREYYKNTNFKYKYVVPKNHTQSAMLKKIIKKGYKNNTIDSQFTTITNYNIYDENPHIERIEYRISSLFYTYRIDNNGYEIDTSNQSMNMFINSFMKVFSWDFDEIINMINKILKNNNDIPFEFSKYIVNQITNYHYDNGARSYFFSGVASNTLLTNSILSMQKKEYSKGKDAYSTIDDKDTFPFKDLDVDYAVDNQNMFSLVNRLLIFQIKNHNNEMEDVAEVNIFTDKAFDKYDLVFTIAPELLEKVDRDFLINSSRDEAKVNAHEEHSRWEYPLSTNNLSSYIYFKNTLFLTKNISYILVPLSFISLNVFNKYYNINDTEEEHMINYKSKVLMWSDDYMYNRNKTRDNILFYERIHEIITKQNISKVIQFPNNYFSHIKTECVLLEIKKEPVDGIHFTKLGISSPSSRSGISLGANIIDIIQHNKPKDLKLNPHITMKWTSYEDILDEEIGNYNITPLYQLSKQSQFKYEEKLSKKFLVRKVQKYNFKIAEKEDSANNIELRIVTVSDFTEFGAITQSKLKTIYSIKSPFHTKDKKKGNQDIEKRNKFNEQYQLQQYDILIYVHDPKKIAICDEKIDNTVASHNLILIRMHKDIDNKEGYTKELYMSLKSDYGQQKLKQILTKDTKNRNVLRIQDLENMMYQLLGLERDIHLFNDYKRQYEALEYMQNKLAKSLSRHGKIDDFSKSIADEYERKRADEKEARKLKSIARHRAIK